MINNFLLNDFNTLYSTAPFSKINESDYLPAFKTAIEKAKAEINDIIDDKQDPSFSNTIETLECSGELLGTISSIFFNLNSAETTDNLQAIAQEVSPILSEYSNDIRLNKELFYKIKYVFDNTDRSKLSVEQITLLDKTYKSFSRNGADLDEQSKNKLRKIDLKLSELSLRFGENILADGNEFELIVEDVKKLKGLPQDDIDNAKKMAEDSKKEGYKFTLDMPIYIAFVTYVDNRELRETITKAFGARAFKDNSYNNEQIVLDIARLRHERANILGYDNHATYVLEERMAKSVSNVLEFTNDLLDKAKSISVKEFNLLEEYALKDGINKIEKWDSAYYTEKIKKNKFDLDNETLKPYFELNNVLEGAFTIAEKLYGITFKETTEIDVYNKEVRTYIVSDNKGEFLSVFYTDFFPRKGKRNGAWMTSYKSQYIRNNENSSPHISIVCNFTKPTGSKPSFLTFMEVTTLFHEFGHALHGMLANTTYSSLSGTSVLWDFVELPSQLMENWCYQKEALSLFAKHYETGEVLPQEYIDKIKAAANFIEGSQTMRQLSFGLLDMKWHSEYSSEIKNIKDLEKSVFENIDLYPSIETSCMSTAFAHIFQGGYSAAYYSYKWAEVLDADVFSVFEENGIFDAETANSFKENILSKGGTIDPMDLYEKFRGKKPDSKALLKRAGLV